MSQVVAVNAAYDLNPKYITNPPNHIIKRQSKTGLNLFLLKQKTVHFVLDNIIMDQVPLKSYKGEGPNNRSITGAELRWIYKHRDNIEVQENIQFWFRKKPTSPPWVIGSENYSAEWNNYIRDSKPLIDVSAVTLGAAPLAAAPVAAPTKGFFSCLFCCFD